MLRRVYQVDVCPLPDLCGGSAFGVSSPITCQSPGCSSIPTFALALQLQRVGPQDSRPGILTKLMP